MIPRYQAILFVVLLAASLVMGLVLLHLRDRAHQRLVAGQDSAPTRAPLVAPAEQATLLVADDADDSLLPLVQSLPLPADPGARARAVLGKLLDLYATPGAAHPVPGGSGSVAQVFLLPIPGGSGSGGSGAGSGSGSGAGLGGGTTAASRSAGAGPAAADTESKQPLLAVVNLTGAFAASHPSGIETESLTVLSICGTLHANLPRVAQVRFLVDGKTRPTLAGHADLTRTYLAADAVPGEAVHP
jgi:Sporulation and spore germination